MIMPIPQHDSTHDGCRMVKPLDWRSKGVSMTARTTVAVYKIQRIGKGPWQAMRNGQKWRSNQSLDVLLVDVQECHNAHVTACLEPIPPAEPSPQPTPPEDPEAMAHGWDDFCERFKIDDSSTYPIDWVYVAFKHGFNAAFPSNPAMDAILDGCTKVTP